VPSCADEPTDVTADVAADGSGTDDAPEKAVRMLVVRDEAAGVSIGPCGKSAAALDALLWVANIEPVATEKDPLEPTLACPPAAAAAALLRSRIESSVLLRAAVNRLCTSMSARLRFRPAIMPLRASPP
jgi:hypothetical protein